MSRFYPGFSHFLPVGFLGLTNSTVTSELTLSPSQTAVALDIPGVRPSPRPGRRRGVLSHALEGPPVGTGALRRPPHSQGIPLTRTPEGGHEEVRPPQVGVVYWEGVGCVLHFGHLTPPAFLPPCAVPYTHQVYHQPPAESTGSTLNTPTGRPVRPLPTTFIPHHHPPSHNSRSRSPALTARCGCGGPHPLHPPEPPPISAVPLPQVKVQSGPWVQTPLFGGPNDSSTISEPCSPDPHICLLHPPPSGPWGGGGAQPTPEAGSVAVGPGHPTEPQVSARRGEERRSGHVAHFGVCG